MDSTIFKAYDVRGKVGTQLTEAVSKKIGAAFARWLPTAGIVAVGRDMRPDSASLSAAFIDGLRSQGRDVWDVGQVTSDMIYFAVGKYGLAGGAVITASHNPGADNGIKLYRDQVIAVGLDSGLDRIRDLAMAASPLEPAPKKGALSQKDITADWVDHCLTFVNHLQPFRIAIDAGNGMAGAVLPFILPKLPIQAQRMYFEVDGTFPNHDANPSEIKNLKDLIHKIKEERLDFGLAFDGDGDRAVIVDDLGRPVQGSDVLSLVSKYYLSKYPGAEIIHDVRTSRATQELIGEWGGKPVRVKAGRVVIGTVMRQRGAPFGGETSGHLFFKENYFADSGLIAALVVIQALSGQSQKLSELVDEFRRYKMIPETNFEVKDKTAALKAVKATFADGQQDEIDGITVNYPTCWFNLRPSNTENLVRLNAEATSDEELEQLVSKIKSVINT